MLKVFVNKVRHLQPHLFYLKRHSIMYPTLCSEEYHPAIRHGLSNYEVVRVADIRVVDTRQRREC